MKQIRFLLCLLALVQSAMAVTGTTLYETSFERPGFTPGQPLRGQDNWEMYHDGEAISVSTNNARTGLQCLQFTGALLEQNGPNSVTAYGFSRALYAYSNNPPAIVEISASVRLDGPGTGTKGTPDQDILSANLMAVVPRGDGLGQSLGGFFVSSAGKIWSYSADPADAYKYSVPYTFGTYRTLRLRVDFVARTLEYFVDDVALGAVGFPASITTDRLYGGYIYLNGALDPIETPDLTYRMGDYTAYFDDYSIVSVPLSPVNAVIEFASTNVLTDEFLRAASVTVTRRGFTDAAVRVRLSTTNGTAVAGEDYEAVSAFVTFGAGETTKLFEVPLRDDFFAEPDRVFTVSITDLPPGATSGKPRASVLIRDDERPGSIDYSWRSDYGLPPRRPNEVKYAVPIVYPFPMQADGKPIVSFNIEVPNATPVFRVVRLNADGSLDPSFPPIQRTRWVTGWPLPSGKVVILEEISPRGARVSRRNADGTQDPTFTSTITNRWVNGVKGLPDGRMYVYGDSIGAGGQQPRNLVRLNADGTQDQTFSAQITANVSVLVWPLKSGKVLVTRTQGGGTGTDLGVWLLHEDGSMDTGFSVGTGVKNAGRISGISTVIVQPDGKFVLGGLFTTFNGRLCNSIVRLNVDGSVDETFATGLGFTNREFDGSRVPGFISIHSLSDGRVLVSDMLDQFNGQPVTGPILLNSDGSRDDSFEGTIPDSRSYLDEFNYVLAMIDDKAILFQDYGLARLRMDLPLRIVSHNRNANGVGRLSVNGLTGRSYTLQTSENLADWSDLLTQVASTNRVDFLDAPATATPQRFYRVKQK